MICSTCSNEIQSGARFCSTCGRRISPEYVPLSDTAAREGLVRPMEGRAIAGVCRGFAQRYGWDVAIVRLVLVLAVFFGVGTPVLAYVIAWIVMPNGPYFVPAAPQGEQPQA